MGPNSKIEFSPGTLFIKNPEDDNWQEFAKVEDIEFEPPLVDTDTVYIRKLADNAEFTITFEPLTIWTRFKLFGFWETIKSLLRRKRK